MASEFLRQTREAALSARGHNDPALRALVMQYRAEARFLRALSYWHGIDFFGNIPLVTENSPIGATPPQQSTRAAIYDYIVSELNAIVDSLPLAGAATYGRATRYAASMLLAKVYLNAGVYTGTTFLIHAACGGSMSNATYGIDGCWWGIRLKPEAYNFYEAGDTARTSFFYTGGQNVAMASLTNFTDGIAAPKFSNVTSTGQPGSHGTFPDTDFPMLRLADAYLIYAEAHLRGGGGSATQALDYVNALRLRAYGDSSGVITAGQLDLDFILAERGRELLWEGHRRTDLIRFGRFTGGTYLWAWKGGALGGVATQAY